jgi:hypothetical protein
MTTMYYFTMATIYYCSMVTIYYVTMITFFLIIDVCDLGLAKIKTYIQFETFK